VATTPGLVQKKGSHYTYGELRLRQGRDTAIAFLREHEEVVAELTEAIRSIGAKLQAPPSGNRAGEEIEVVEISCSKGNVVMVEVVMMVIVGIVA
jgi:hypothetical protein